LKSVKIIKIFIYKKKMQNDLEKNPEFKKKIKEKNGLAVFFL
jgi:uncharacterized protein YneF (UPF0154 family)